MPMRVVPLVTGETYHIFNRGVAKQAIFCKRQHYQRFERTMVYYRNMRPYLRFSKYIRIAAKSPNLLSLFNKQPIINQVSIVAYCLMPNHFHLLLTQLTDNGISNFMRNLGNSYTRYFNTNCRRIGPIFQGQFKAVAVESNYQLLHLSRYIHINPVVAGMASKEDLSSYRFSSYSQYLRNTPSSFVIVEPSMVINQFTKRHSYERFCLDQIDYGLTLSAIKHSLIDGLD